MTIKDSKSISNYADLVMQSNAMLENLSEFFATLPAPNDDGSITGMNYSHLGTIFEIHSRLTTASEMADEMND